MATWDPSQYMKFAGERGQPTLDLIARVPLASPARIIDLGSGPGNSTEMIASRWPDSRITGLDSSAEMMAKARRDFPRIEWQDGDIATWSPAEPYDLVFSNAALQWVPDHETVFPGMLHGVAKGGVLAVQMPRNQTAPSHNAMREVAEAGPWRDKLRNIRDQNRVPAPSFYYDLLRPLARKVELWETEYLHVMESPQAILDWVRGTGLRPFIAPLADDERKEFETRYLAALTRDYARRQDGKVLFPFRRLFILALP